MTDESNGGLGIKLVTRMSELTRERTSGQALTNARRNLGFLQTGKSIVALRGALIGQGKSAVIIAAGPSMRRRDPARALLDAGYAGAVVTTESALLYCLRAGLVPDLTVSVDPHADRIVRWFGDPNLSEDSLRLDDYFSRQDQDAAFADEMKANREILALIDRYGPRLKIALATSASEAVARRVHDAGMDIYWWNPMLDDPDETGSVTAQLEAENGLPSVNAGGNVGAAAWMMASEVLGKVDVALTGVDFSYYDGTPYRNTQYWREAVDLVGEDNLDSIFIRIFNPHVGEWFFTDPAYMWYRECLLAMIADSECQTSNCTEGGILFGNNICFEPLREFLARHTSVREATVAR
ncbi:MAG: hypothetical protein EXQ90_04300 [Rhodospirillales bacterium]|nr:hypothetical protein [Rhodospirillales bacterium]